MSVTAALVKELREKSGAGMMDCKKALVEAEGDFDKAVENLRKKGQKVAANRADRDSSEGAALAKVNDDHTAGVLISVNCETDFCCQKRFLSRIGACIGRSRSHICHERCFLVQ